MSYSDTLESQLSFATASLALAQPRPQLKNATSLPSCVDIFEAHHYCSTTKCWIVVDDLEGYACFVAHIDPECPGDTDDEYFAEGLELTDEERAWLETY